MSQPAFIRLVLPDWLRGTYHQNYDDAPNQAFPTDPADPKHRNVMGMVTPLDTIHWPGSKLKGFTHLYAQDGIAKSERLWTILANQLTSRSTTCQDGWITLEDGTKIPNIKNIPTPQEAYDLGWAIAANYDQWSIVTDEFTDSSSAICPNAYWSVVDKFYQGFSARLGNPSPAQNNFMGGYMDGQNNITRAKFNMQNGGYTASPTHEYYWNGLDSAENARKSVDTTNRRIGGDFEFFSRGMHNRLNLMTGCYVGLNEPDESHFLYGMLNEVFRKYIAGIKRTVLYCSPWSQAVTLNTDTQSQNPGYIHSWNGVPGYDADDYFRIQDWHMTPTWALSFIGFFGQLLAEGWTQFDSMRWEQSKDFLKMTESNDLRYRGNGEPSRFNWHTKNGHARPVLGADSSSPGYNWRPLTNIDLQIAMTNWFRIVYPISKAAGGPKHFAHTADGLEVPIRKGVLGANVITAQCLNYGQNTIMDLADKQAGFCIGATIGSQYFIAYYNPYQSPMPEDAQEIIVTMDNDKKINMGKLTGRTVHVVYAY